jgi:predicted PurR-regulated permease PerM
MRAVRKHWSLIAFLAVLILLFVLIYSFRSVLLPFLFGLVLAYILLPVIRWTESRLPAVKRHIQLRRVSLIAGIFVGFLALASLFFIFTFISVRPAIITLVSNSTNYYNSTYDQLIQISAQITDPILDQFPAEVHARLDKLIYDTGLNAVNSLTNSISS